MMLLSAITLSLQLQRTSFDLLDGLNVEVAAHNSNKAPVSVRFPGPAEYVIDVLREGTVVWSSLPRNAAASTVPAHLKELMPGPTVLAVYIWNETSTDGRSLTPGDYTLRARLLGDTASPQASVRVHFTAPTPVSALSALHAGDEVTIAGRLDAAQRVLNDSTGSVVLAKRLLNAPEAPVAVRGYLMTLPDRTRAFFVERWAPLGT